MMKKEAQDLYLVKNWNKDTQTFLILGMLLKSEKRCSPTTEVKNKLGKKRMESVSQFYEQPNTSAGKQPVILTLALQSSPFLVKYVET